MSHVLQLEPFILAPLLEGLNNEFRNLATLILITHRDTFFPLCLLSVRILMIRLHCIDMLLKRLLMGNYGANTHASFNLTGVLLIFAI